MKVRVKTLCYILLIITFSFGNEHKVSGQKELNLTGGFGMPELLNIGIRYQTDQVQFGLSIGSMPLGSHETIFSVGGDLFYHFGGTSAFSARRPWYGRAGLNYIRDETESVIDKYLYLNTRIGRDFNLSKRVGISADAGAIFQLSYNEIKKKPTSNWLNIEMPVMPSIGITFFYRIGLGGD